MTHDAPAALPYLPTRVPGLDAILGGGVPEGSFNLIAGSCGTGKTTLAHQLMFGLATPERTALYISSLGESPLKMLQHQQQFGFFNLDQVNRSVHLVNLALTSSSGNLNQVLEQIHREVELRKPAFVFIDSFRSLWLAPSLAQKASQPNGTSANPGMPDFLYRLNLLMSSWQTTTFLVAEYFTTSNDDLLFTVVDGLIWLHQTVQENAVSRKLEVVKMRGQPTLPGRHTFRITAHGLSVFAPYQPLPTMNQWGRLPTLDRASLGIAGLDHLLGGGLPRGHSLLVAGPSGSGKSTMAAAFLSAGARAGETGVIAAFEQRQRHARGLEMAALIKADRVGVVDTTPMALSVDEISTLLVAEVDRLNATRVVIDSLSGLEMLLAADVRADFRVALSRLLAALTDIGVTVMIISEIEDRYNDLRLSPSGTAFMADAIIVHRYVESSGHLLRMLLVAKVRGSWHSNELHQFHIDNEGLHLDAALHGHEGLLGGRPAALSHGARVTAP